MTITMLKEQSLEECDATDDAKCTIAQLYSLFTTHYSLLTISMGCKDKWIEKVNKG